MSNKRDIRNLNTEESRAFWAFVKKTAQEVQVWSGLMVQRDPERIPRILDRLKEFWMANPDLRFHQMVAIISGLDDNFYLEDDKFEEQVERCLSMNTNTNANASTSI